MNRTRDLFLLALLVEIGNTQGTVQFMTLLWVWCRAFVPHGAPPGIRTQITSIKSRVHWPIVLVEHGGPTRTRTGHLILARDAFYQMNYKPITLASVLGIEPR